MQNLRCAFELQSTLKWNIFTEDVKQVFLIVVNNNMDKAKDLSFLNWLDMQDKKKHCE